MVLADYTHLLNYITWFNEASIQSKLNSRFGSNLTSAEVLSRTSPSELELLREDLVKTFLYMFNKPDVNSSSVQKVDADDVTVAAVWSGVSKDLIEGVDGEHIAGSTDVFNAWKQRAWNNEHETGLYCNSFTFTVFEGAEEVPHIGIAVSMLDVVIVIIIQTEKDNSKDPKRPSHDPSDPSEERGICTDGLDIEVCDEEDDDDDCEPISHECDSNFLPAN